MGARPPRGAKRDIGFTKRPTRAFNRRQGMLQAEERMRALLVYLVCAAGVTLASPAFWWLLKSETSAAESQTIHQNGVVQTTFSGPKAYWPDWALAPEGARIDVQMHQAAAPGYPNGGFGYLKFAGPVDDEIAALQTRLAAVGWEVSTNRHETVEPTLPPRKGSLCIVTATRATEQRMVRYIIFPSGTERSQVHWWEGLPAPAGLQGAGPPC